MSKLLSHILFAISIIVYILVVGQNWGVYTSAILVALWLRMRGELNAVPFKIGNR